LIGLKSKLDFTLSRLQSRFFIKWYVGEIDCWYTSKIYERKLWWL